MRSKGGISFQTIENLIVVFFAIVIVGVLIYRLQVKIDVKNVIEENEVLINRKIIYAKVLLSSSDIAYTDKNGVHKGVIDYETDKVKTLTSEQLFSKYSYQSDGISKGYSHYIRIDVLEPKIETLIECDEKCSKPSRMLPPPEDALEFPVDIRYSKDDVRLGKLYVDITKS